MKLKRWSSLSHLYLKQRKLGEKSSNQLAGVNRKIVSGQKERRLFQHATHSTAQRNKENEVQEFGWSEVAKKAAVNSVSRASSALIGTSYLLVANFCRGYL